MPKSNPTIGKTNFPVANNAICFLNGLVAIAPMKWMTQPKSIKYTMYMSIPEQRQKKKYIKVFISILPR